MIIMVRLITDWFSQIKVLKETVGDISWELINCLKGTGVRRSLTAFTSGVLLV